MIRFAFSLINILLVGIPYLGAQVQLGETIQDLDSLARIGSNMDFSADGLRLLAGAPNASEAYWLGGKVKVFDLIDDVWVQVGQNLLGTGENDYFGTNLSMSADGSSFVVGVRNTGNQDILGTVVAYELQDGQWDTLGQVIATGTDGYARQSVQMSGDGNRIASFVNYMDGQEAVQVYEWQNDLWQPMGMPILPPAGVQFEGVMTFSADGQTVAVNGINNVSFRRFMVYRLLNGEWISLGQPVLSSESSDLFAWSMSISSSGQRIAVGVPRSNANGADSGNVLVYELIDEQWAQVGSNIPGENNLDQTGFSVALSGNGQRLAVGDHYYDEPEFNAGRMRVFQWLEDDWVQVGDEVVGEERADFYGQKVAISIDGSTVGVGAPQGGDGSDTPGQIKVFGNYPWTVISSVSEPTEQVHIFPNPVQNFLFVDAPANSSWQVFDLLGQPIVSGKIEVNSIDLSALLPGVYTVQIQIGQHRFSAKLIKQ